MKTLVTVLISFMLLSPAAFGDGIGPAAPGFTLRDVNGNQVALEDLRGRVVLLDFWAPWCGTCRYELPQLDSLAKKYRAAGLEVIGISVESPEDAVAKAVRKLDLSFTVLIDEKGTVAEAYRITHLPTAVLIGRDGVIRKEYKGYDKSFPDLYEQAIAKELK